MRVMVCFLSIIDVYGVERIVFFDCLKRFDESFCLEMLEKLNDGIASIHFGITAGVGNAAFLENVIEGDDVVQVLVKFDFGDAANDVIFEREVHEAVANVWRVEKSR